MRLVSSKIWESEGRAQVREEASEIYETTWNSMVMATLNKTSGVGDHIVDEMRRRIVRRAFDETLPLG